MLDLNGKNLQINLKSPKMFGQKKGRMGVFMEGGGDWMVWMAGGGECGRGACASLVPGHTGQVYSTVTTQHIFHLGIFRLHKYRMVTFAHQLLIPYHWDSIHCVCIIYDNFICCPSITCQLMRCHQSSNICFNTQLLLCSCTQTPVSHSLSP